MGVRDAFYSMAAVHLDSSERNAEGSRVTCNLEGSVSGADSYC